MTRFLLPRVAAGVRNACVFPRRPWRDRLPGAVNVAFQRPTARQAVFEPHGPPARQLLRCNRSGLWRWAFCRQLKIKISSARFSAALTTSQSTAEHCSLSRVIPIYDVLGKNAFRHYHFHLACFSTETETRLGLAIESTKAKLPPSPPLAAHRCSRQWPS